MKVSRYDLLNKQCPLLCKEFIIDAWQLYYARSKGADAVLLIAAVLPDRDINYMLKICKKLGMAALVEVSKLFLLYVLYAQAFRLSSLAALH
jgi:indole-3-glycerol phosphate synthase